MSGLESAVDTAATNLPPDVEKVDTEAGKLTGTDDGKFKYGKLTDNVGSLESTIDTAAENLPEDVSTVNTEASKLTGQDAGFKFGSVKSGVDDLVSAGNEFVTENTKEELGDVQSAADGLSGNKENFKYANLTSQTDGVGKLIDEASGGTEAGTQLTGLGEGAEKVAGVNYGVNGSVKNLADDIKTLKSKDLFNWLSILNVFNNLPGYADKLNADTITKIAGAFAGLGGDKAQAWQTLMDALGSDLSALSALTGEDEQSAAAWLEDMKNAANGLNNTDVDAWDKLLTALAKGTPEAGNLLTFNDMYKVAEAMGIADTTYVEFQGQVMSMTDANAVYLESLERLVQIYPELSDMINTETGEIKGGTTALQERIDKIAERQETEALLYGLEQKRLALEKKFAELPSLRVDVALASNEYEKQKKAVEELNKELAKYNQYIDDDGHLQYIDNLAQTVELTREFDDYLIENGDAFYGVIDAYQQSKKELEGLREEYDKQIDAYNKTSQKYDELKDKLKDVQKAQEDGAGAANTYNEEQQKAAKEGVTALTDALKDMNDYIDRTRKSTEDSLDSSLKGFAKFELGADYIRRLQTEAEAELVEWKEKEAKAEEKAAKAHENYTSGTFVGKTTIPTIKNMTKALEDQQAFIEEYQKNIQTLQDWGLSKDFLAQFADMSQENAGYLHVMVTEGQDAALSVSKAFDDMDEAKKPLVDSLTELKLQADDDFNELVEKAKQAAIDLNNGDIAKASMEATIQGIADGINSKVADVKEAVDALNAELARLGDYDANSNLNGIFGSLGGMGFSLHLDGRHENGLDYVPFNNYLAALHEGESILTAEEARIWRDFKTGGIGNANTIDYAQLSGAIWDNAPHMGGNVYLDGATVGRVISAQQANSVRTLERSGWQG